MATGAFYHEELPDIIIPSRGLILSIVRTYKSRLIYKGPFGYGWAWNHAQRIIPQQSGDLIYYKANRWFADYVPSELIGIYNED